MKPLFARFRASKPWRAWKRYGDARGNILAAGVGYFAFFSIFPAVALAFTVFGFVLHGHPELLGSIADNLNANLPGLRQGCAAPQRAHPDPGPARRSVDDHRCHRLRQPGAGRDGLAGRCPRGDPCGLRGPGVRGQRGHHQASRPRCALHPGAGHRPLRGADQRGRRGRRLDRRADRDVRSGLDPHAGGARGQRRGGHGPDDAPAAGALRRRPRTGATCPRGRWWAGSGSAC